MTNQTLLDPLTQLALTEVGAPLTTMFVNSSSTVQPNILVRTPIFVPELKKTGKESAYTEMDVSTELNNLNIVNTEGYSSVKIMGPRLSMSIDFKVWCGIVWALNTSGYSTDRIKLSFKDFAKMCGYESKRFDEKLRTTIRDSLTRLRSNTLQFSSKGVERTLVTGLVLAAEFDVTLDTVEILADKRLWDLYLIDHQILLSLRLMKKLPRQHTAQCLYLFLQALPFDTGPISFARLRFRLQLNSKNKEANRIIHKAIEQLIGVGYLRGYTVKKGLETFLFIEKRCPKLTLSELF